MKKVIIILALMLGGLCAQAQVNPHALGLRLGGDGNVNGAEISYQQALGGKNRLELDLGFGGNKNQSRVYLAGIYQWNWNIKGGLNWYAGPGATLGFYSYDNFENHVNVGVGGQVGLEYDFNSMKAPILLSLDTRPMWNFIGYGSGLGWGVALGIRYTW